MLIRRPADPCYDVVVVGARAAGAATAHLLARSGLACSSSTAAATAPTPCPRTP